jgi:hypothetical protein
MGFARTDRATLLLAVTASANLARAMPAAAERPLPLASNYNTGQLPDGFTPTWQMHAIEEGHHLLLTLSLAAPDQKWDAAQEKYFADVLERAAARHLPLCFYSPDWEAVLASDPRYLALPAAESPLVVEGDGKVAGLAAPPAPPHATLSPFGPVRVWTAVGRRWTDSELIHKLEEKYPDPPLVIFVSNNEARRLAWKDAPRDRRYRGELGGRPDEEAVRRQLVGDRYLERFRALLTGLREGLGAWREPARFGAYGASPLRDIGRARGWLDDSLYLPGRVAIEPLIWDRVAPSQYVTTWREDNDYSVDSPQTDAMNLVVEQQLYQEQNPRLAWEVSVWNGQLAPGIQGIDKPSRWRAEGQRVPPERYQGLVKFLMWLPRAEVVRDFRWWHESREPKDGFAGAEKAFSQVIAAVDEIHGSPLLARFWRNGELVANRAHEHPYQEEVPEDIRARPRWFRLDTDADPPYPFGKEAVVEVWSFAYVLGRPGNREWLVYAFAPRGDRRTRLWVPDYGKISTLATQAGAYYHVAERARRVTRVLALRVRR